MVKGLFSYKGKASGLLEALKKEQARKEMEFKIELYNLVREITIGQGRRIH